MPLSRRFHSCVSIPSERARGHCLDEEHLSPYIVFPDPCLYFWTRGFVALTDHRVCQVVYIAANRIFSCNT